MYESFGRVAEVLTNNPTSQFMKRIIAIVALSAACLFLGACTTINNSTACCCGGASSCCGSCGGCGSCGD